MLMVEHLEGGYGRSQVLFDIGFRIDAGELVTLLGRNGMGKTTTVRTYHGSQSGVAWQDGVAGQSLIGRPPEGIAKILRHWHRPRRPAGVSYADNRRKSHRHSRQPSTLGEIRGRF